MRHRKGERHREGRSNRKRVTRGASQYQLADLPPGPAVRIDRGYCCSWERKPGSEDGSDGSVDGHRSLRSLHCSSCKSPSRGTLRASQAQNSVIASVIQGTTRSERVCEQDPNRSFNTPEQPNGSLSPPLPLLSKAPGHLALRQFRKYFSPSSFVSSPHLTFFPSTAHLSITLPYQTACRAQATEQRSSVRRSTLEGFHSASTTVALCSQAASFIPVVSFSS